MIHSFSVGDKVRVVKLDPPGHIRTPFYLRGKKGIIEHIHGSFKDPEKLAFGQPGLPKRILYLVRFFQLDIWNDYKGSSKDSLIADIYEQWLERY